MTYGVIYSLPVLIEKLAFFNKQFKWINCILNRWENPCVCSFYREMFRAMRLRLTVEIQKLKCKVKLFKYKL